MKRFLMLLMTLLLMIPAAQAEQAPLPTLADIPETLWYNHDGGSRYHVDAHCAAISEKYWNIMQPLTVKELFEAPYDQLTPCSMCGAGAVLSIPEQLGTAWLTEHAGLDADTLASLHCSEVVYQPLTEAHDAWTMTFANANDVPQCQVILDAQTGRVIGYSWLFYE